MHLLCVGLKREAMSNCIIVPAKPRSLGFSKGRTRLRIEAP